MRRKEPAPGLVTVKELMTEQLRVNVYGSCRSHFSLTVTINLRKCTKTLQFPHFSNILYSYICFILVLRYVRTSFNIYLFLFHTRRVLTDPALLLFYRPRGRFFIRSFNGRAAGFFIRSFNGREAGSFVFSFYQPQGRFCVPAKSNTDTWKKVSVPGFSPGVPCSPSDSFPGRRSILTSGIYRLFLLTDPGRRNPVLTPEIQLLRLQ